MTQSKRRTLKDQQTEWYAKLKETGFEDIEYADGSIKAGHPRSFHSLDPIQRAAKQEYYAMCEAYLYNGTFESELDRTIFEYHANGIGIRDIVEILKKAGIRKKNRDSVNKALKRVITAMKAKYLSV